MKFKLWAAIALIVLASARASADDQVPSGWSRFVQGTKDLFRAPRKRAEPSNPPRAPDATRASYNAPVPKSAGAAKAPAPDSGLSGPSAAPTGKSGSKSTSLFARWSRRPPRTVSEYMAQERP